MGRAPCCDKANVKKGPWSPEEDSMLKEYIQKHGTGGNWISLPQKAGLRRCGKSCRLRWLNYLRPNIKHGEFSDEEDRIICTLYANIGSRWSIIAAQLPGRTDNDIKNYWNTKLKKKLANLVPPQESISHHNTISPYSSSFPSQSHYNQTPTNYTTSFTSNYIEPMSCYVPNPTNFINYHHNNNNNQLDYHNYYKTDNSVVNVMFGSEGSCCSSISDGTKQEESEIIKFQNFMQSNNHNNNFFNLGDGNHWERENVNFCFGQNEKEIITTSTSTCLDYQNIEYIKQLISSNHDNYEYFKVDENKSEEKTMYLY